MKLGLAYAAVSLLKVGAVRGSHELADDRSVGISYVRLNLATPRNWLMRGISQKSSPLGKSDSLSIDLIARGGFHLKARQLQYFNPLMIKYDRNDNE